MTPNLAKPAPLAASSAVLTSAQLKVATAWLEADALDETSAELDADSLEDAALLDAPEDPQPAKAKAKMAAIAITDSFFIYTPIFVGYQTFFIITTQYQTAVNIALNESRNVPDDYSEDPSNKPTWARW